MRGIWCTSESVYSRSEDLVCLGGSDQTSSLISKTGKILGAKFIRNQADKFQTLKFKMFTTWRATRGW